MRAKRSIIGNHQLVDFKGRREVVEDNGCPPHPHSLGLTLLHFFHPPHPKPSSTSTPPSPVQPHLTAILRPPLLTDVLQRCKFRVGSYSYDSAKMIFITKAYGYASKKSNSIALDYEISKSSSSPHSHSC